MPATLQQLTGIRSQLAENVLEYLNETAAWAAILPDYFPEHLCTNPDGKTGFDDVRQLVQVRKDMPKREPVPADGKTVYDPHHSRPENRHRDYLWSEQPNPNPPISWDDTAGDQFNRAVVLGDPGYGKTWLLRFELRRLARKAALPLAERSIELNDIVLPIFARLPEICNVANPVEEVLIAQIGQGRSEAFRQFVRDRLKSDRCVVLLDAWDEVPETGAQGDLRTPLLLRLQQFSQQFRLPRLLLTSRTLEFRESPIRQVEVRDSRIVEYQPVQELELLAFETGQMESVVNVWFSGQTERDRILSLLRENAQVHGLARIPLMLTLMCRVWQEDLKQAKPSLTTNRCELFERCLRGLLGEWPRDDKKVLRPKRSPAYVDAMQELLQYVAFMLVSENRQQFEESLFRRKMAGFCENLKPGHELLNQTADSIIAELKEDGILSTSILRSDSSLIFLHRIFQEYLAACHLVHAVEPASKHLQDHYLFASVLTETFPDRLVELARSDATSGSKQWWEATLLAGVELERRSPEKAWQFIDALCPHNCGKEKTDRDSHKNTDWRMAWLAGQVLLETTLGFSGTLSHPMGEKGGEGTIERVKSWLGWLLDDGRLTVRERAAAGVVVGKLGDPRPGVGLGQHGLPHFDWVVIKPGKFKMGGTDSWEGGKEFPCKLIKKPYRISRYPVTVAQFRAFVDDKGYEREFFTDKPDESKRIWTKAGWAWRQQNYITGPTQGRDIFQTPNHPQVVSWYEAIAFCRWLTYCMREKGLLRAEEIITLPSEAEWERAARGTKGNPFTWGSDAQNLGEKCNCDESGLGSTSSVGMFPLDNSEDDVRDLSGNVWEWCRTKWLDSYEDYEARVDDDLEGQDERVLRGGSFILILSGDLRASDRCRLLPYFLRAAYRDRKNPHGKYYCIGLRLCVVSVPRRHEWA